MNIVAFDPGETTGFIAVRYFGGYQFGVVRSMEIFWGERFAKVKSMLRHYKPAHIVTESFRLYPHAARNQIGKDFPSVQVIGIINTYAYEMGMLDRITLQPASVRSNVKILPEHEQELLATPHTRDAYMHVRYFIITQHRKGLLAQPEVA